MVDGWIYRDPVGWLVCTFTDRSIGSMQGNNWRGLGVLTPPPPVPLFSVTPQPLSSCCIADPPSSFSQFEPWKYGWPVVGLPICSFVIWSVGRSNHPAGLQSIQPPTDRSPIHPSTNRWPTNQRHFFCMLPSLEFPLLGVQRIPVSVRPVGRDSAAWPWTYACKPVTKIEECFIQPSWEIYHSLSAWTLPG